MSALSLNDAVAIEGGPLSLGAALPGLPANAILGATATLNFLVKVFLNNLQDRDTGIFIALTHSSGLACRVHELADGASAILVPAGLLGRLRTLCRTLLRYWDKEHHILMANSPLDKIPEDQWQVPPRLAPLFDHKETGDRFWKHLQRLDDSLDLDPKFDPDVQELLHLGLIFLLCHEFAHVSFRHFQFLAMLKQSNPSEVSRARRGLELHADSFAGTWATILFLSQPDGETDGESIARGLQRQSYVITLILGLFDAHKKFVGFYDRGDYNHPLIRREIVAEACQNEASLRGEEFLKIWREIEAAGWARAVNAFAELNLESMQGKFGKIQADKLAYPLQSMNYGAGAAVFSLQKILDEANRLLNDIKAQVKAFNDTFAGHSPPATF